MVIACRGSRWRTLAALGCALVLLGAADRVHATPFEERAASLEAQIAEKKRAIEQIERRNADLKRGVDANPANTGANFSARQEMRTNARYVAVYQGELEQLERSLAAVRAAATAAVAEPPVKPRRPERPAVAPPPVAEPVVRDPVAPPAEPESDTTDPGTLGRGEVRELMRSWALGQSGVPGMGAYANDETPLAIVMRGLDWWLDWRELAAGLVLGALAGAAIPWATTWLLRRRLPARAPVVGAMSRKWVSAAGAAGAPSKQWLDLSTKAAAPARVAAAAAGFVALALAVQAVASWIGWGPRVGTPGIGGELVMLVVAVALAAGAMVLWRQRTFEPAFAAACGLGMACVVPAALGLSPFGGRGAWVWVAVLGVGTALEMRAATVLWPLTGPRATLDASRRTTVANTAIGAVVGLVVAALYLASA